MLPKHISVIGFLRTILIILAVYFLIRWIARLAAPLLAKWARRQMEKKMGEMGGQQYQQPNNNQRRQGDVTVEYTQREKSSSGKNSGEYVDYEEVE